MKRKICIATGTRADWGLLSPIAQALNKRDDVDLKIIATNMHLSEEYGSTWKEIENDGLKIDWRVKMKSDADTRKDTVLAMSECMAGMAEALAALRPDLLVILGDRYEMLATASAALILRIPIAHIAGGAISQGAYDESIRHAITKMSHIHLTETERYRKRVIQLGENPEHVIYTGAIGVYNIMHTQYISREQLERELNLTLSDRLILATFHPATLDEMPPQQQCKNLLAALDRHPDYQTIFTYPNNDSEGRIIIQLIESYRRRHPERVAVFPSLGMRRYLSMLHCATAVVGNSSSGIVEVPSIGIPTLDIGIRQMGRTAAPSVLHCGVSEEEIADGLETVLSSSFRLIAKSAENPYYLPDTLEKMVDAIVNTPLDNIIIKPFYDVKFK
ncbi:MAG: UDP-N-acetylglucosamine 2-epimerase [Candidatus Limisoma sp.]